jgi:hypothetical protein
MFRATSAPGPSLSNTLSFVKHDQNDTHEPDFASDIVTDVDKDIAAAIVGCTAAALFSSAAVDAAGAARHEQGKVTSNPLPPHWVREVPITAYKRKKWGHSANFAKTPA